MRYLFFLFCFLLQPLYAGGLFPYEKAVYKVRIFGLSVGTSSAILKKLTKHKYALHSQTRINFLKTFNIDVTSEFSTFNREFRQYWMVYKSSKAGDSFLRKYQRGPCDFVLRNYKIRNLLIKGRSLPQKMKFYYQNRLIVVSLAVDPVIMMNTKALGKIRVLPVSYSASNGDSGEEWLAVKYRYLPVYAKVYVTRYSLSGTSVLYTLVQR